MRANEDSNVGFMQIEDTVLKCNQQAMEFMNKNNFVESAKLLLKANQILTNLTPTYSVIKLKAVTLNNLGCVYKRGDDNSKALHYLSQALEYEKRLPEEYTNIAGTHLNLCAIKSHLDDHNAALDHALAAVNIIQRNYTGKHEFVTTLVAAYHNAGIEYQFLNRKIEANNFFRQGYDLAIKNLGKTHALTKNIESMLPQKQEPSFSTPKVQKSIEKREKLRHETIFHPESRIFEDSPEKKIVVDTTPWPKSTEKKTWPNRIDPISQTEVTPKPIVKYPKHVRSEIEIPNSNFPKFPDRPQFNPSEINSDTSSISQPKYPEPHFSQKPSKNSLSERKKPSNIHLHHHEHPVKQKPFNVHSHPHEHLSKEKPQPIKVNQLEPRQNFRISTKPQPKSTNSLNSSPSKSTISDQSLSSRRNPSLNTFNQAITAEKINSLSSKLENLQEKLNLFEVNYQNMRTLEEVQDDESVISTASVVNRRKIVAAVMIQKHFRRFKAQKRFKDMKNAAIHVQRVIRGELTRKMVRREYFKSQDFSQQVALEPVYEPMIIKTEERANQTDQIVKKKLQGQIVLVSKQGVRAWKKRKTLLENIILIQTRIRGFLARKERKKRLTAIRVIQRKMTSVRIRGIYVKVISAAVFIQAVFRGYRVRKQLKLNSAATLIQAIFRGHKARKYAKTLLPRGVVALVQSKKRW